MGNQWILLVTITQVWMRLVYNVNFVALDFAIIL